MEMKQTVKSAWIDERRQIISFEEISDARLYTDKEENFWVLILRLIHQGYAIQ